MRMAAWKRPWFELVHVNPQISGVNRITAFLLLREEWLRGVRVSRIWELRRFLNRNNFQLKIAKKVIQKLYFCSHNFLARIGLHLKHK